ncbi:hypothetical protein FRB96_007054 [Tulasnella sp. 330]|nr:hypothetical protein FRB96_007054 [Tulasnella sp. 330]KAG8872593.1 hypothetical protein FRB97_007492 [Tulasnella sp. 331]KAG8886773.1 hypothetical protein FRB98_000996 [Tulasnella sp. 332]
MSTPSTELQGMVPGKRYNVHLNNKMQSEQIAFTIVNVPSGDRHREVWTCTVQVQTLNGAQLAKPLLRTGEGMTKGQALNVASFLVLQAIGDA